MPVNLDIEDIVPLTSDASSLLRSPLTSRAPLKKSRQPFPPDPEPSPPAVWQINSITSTKPTTLSPLSHTGKCKYLWSCISRNASSNVSSGDTKSGLGVITELTKVSSADRFLATTRLSKSLGVNIPSSVPLRLSITSTPLRTEDINFAASRTVVDPVTEGTFSLPMMERNVGMVSPNICCISVCMARIWAWFERPDDDVFSIAVIVLASTSAPAPAPEPVLVDAPPEVS